MLVRPLEGKGLSNDTGHSQNFLSRTMQSFARRRLNIFESPNLNSSQIASTSAKAGYEQANRINRLFGRIKEFNGLKVSLAGFRPGTVDAVNTVNRFRGSIDGVILFSGINANTTREASNFQRHILQLER